MSFAQTAETLEQITEREQITVGQAAYIAAASAGVIGETESEQAALAALFDSGSDGAASRQDHPVTLAMYSHMLMTAFERDGGLLYSLFPGPRYALRELEFERVIQGGGDPGDTVSGRRALQFASRLRSIAEEEQ